MKFSNLINLNYISIDKCNKQVGMNNRRSSPLSRSPIFSPALLSSCQIDSALTESTIHSPDLLSFHQISHPLTISHPIFSPDLLSSQNISPLTRSSIFTPVLLSYHQIFFSLTRSPLLSPDLFSQQISLSSPDLLSPNHPSRLISYPLV